MLKIISITTEQTPADEVERTRKLSEIILSKEEKEVEYTPLPVGLDIHGHLLVP